VAPPQRMTAALPRAARAPRRAPSCPCPRPPRYCSPRHATPFNSRNEVSNYVGDVASMRWQALPVAAAAAGPALGSATVAAAPTCTAAT